MIEAIAQLPICFAVALSGILIPGPLLVFIIMKTHSFGSRTGVFTAIGHILVEFGIISFIALGFSFVLESELFQIAMGLIGGILLLALGSFYLVRFKGAHEFRPSVIEVKYHPILGGILFSTIFNPGVLLWWATIGLATLMETTLVAALAGAIFWLIGHFLADFGWFSLVSHSVAKGGRVMGTKAYRGLLIACGCTLLAFGAYFLIRYAPTLI